MTTFIIQPIQGREAVQKNFVALPKKADNYSHRHISLNERFSIIERGYNLVPQDTTAAEFKTQLLNLNKKPKTRAELKKQLAEETAKYHEKVERANKKNLEALSPKSQDDDAC